MYYQRVFMTVTNQNSHKNYIHKKDLNINFQYVLKLNVKRFLMTSKRAKVRTDNTYLVGENISRVRSGN